MPIWNWIYWPKSSTTVLMLDDIITFWFTIVMWHNWELERPTPRARWSNALHWLLAVSYYCSSSCTGCPGMWERCTRPGPPYWRGETRKNVSPLSNIWPSARVRKFGRVLSVVTIQYLDLILPMLRLLLLKAKGRKDSLKPPKPCHVGIHWIALPEYSQMSTYLPGFSYFPAFLHNFVLAKLATSSIRINLSIIFNS